MKLVRKQQEPFFYTEPRYDYIGCFKDALPRAIPTLEGNSRLSSILKGHYKKRKNAIQKCYEAASHLNFKFFAVQDGGYCSSSATADTTYKIYGASDASICIDGKGGPMANDVYRIIGKLQMSLCLYNCTWQSNMFSSKKSYNYNVFCTLNSRRRQMSKNLPRRM